MTTTMSDPDPIAWARAKAAELCEARMDADARYLTALADAAEQHIRETDQTPLSVKGMDAWDGWGKHMSANVWRRSYGPDLYLHVEAPPQSCPNEPWKVHATTNRGEWFVRTVGDVYTILRLAARRVRLSRRV